MRNVQYIGLLIISFIIACQGESSEPANAETEQEAEDPRIEALTRQIEKAPENAELYFNRAHAFLEQNQVQKAIDDLKRANELDRDVPHYVLLLSDIYLERFPSAGLPDSKKAIDLLEHYLEENPKSPRVHMQLAEIFIYVEQYQAARDQLDLALEDRAYYPDAHWMKAISYKLEGDTVQAITHLQNTIEQEPDFADAHYELGLLLSRKNNSLAVDYFRNVLRIDSTRQDARYALALFYQNNNQMAEAKQTYREIIQRNPQFERAYYNLGYIYYNQDSLDKAYRNFNRAIQMKPQYSDAYFMRGLMAEEMGRQDRARRDYKQTLNIDPDHELAREGLNRLR